MDQECQVKRKCWQKSSEATIPVSKQVRLFLDGVLKTKIIERAKLELRSLYNLWLK